MRRLARGLSRSIGTALVIVACVSACAPGERTRAGSAGEDSAVTDTTPTPEPPLSATALVPVDEGPRVPDFLAFRTRLLAAIAARDTSALLAAVDPNVQTSFGDAGGIADFRERWKPEAPDSRIWQELGSLLALGGTFTGDSIFVAPYVFATWPESLDAYEHGAVVFRDVTLREAPRADARVLATLDYEIVRLRLSDAPLPPEGWTAVEHAGRAGYVASDSMRFALDYRAIFSRKPEGWKLVILVAGD